MKERGIVVKDEGRLATVRFSRRAKCDRCQVCKVAADCKYVEVQARNSVGAHAGDTVSVLTVRPVITLLIGLIYAIPLTLIAVAVGVGLKWEWPYTVLIAAAAVAVGFVVAVPVERFTLRKLKGYHPEILSVLQSVSVVKPEDCMPNSSRPVVQTESEVAKPEESLPNDSKPVAQPDTEAVKPEESASVGSDTARPEEDKPDEQ